MTKGSIPRYRPGYFAPRQDIRGFLCTKTQKRKRLRKIFPINVNVFQIFLIHLQTETNNAKRSSNKPIPIASQFSTKTNKNKQKQIGNKQT